MTTSEVAICNLALQRLGARPISSLTEDSPNARECNRAYAPARDAELRAHPWNFARTRTQLPALAEAPLFEYAYQYQLPVDCERILTYNGRNNTPDQTDFQIEGRKLLTDLAPPLQLVYIARVTDPMEFDASYTDLLIARLTLDLAEKVTNSNSKKREAAERYEDARRTARRVNGFENSAQFAPEDSWITARL